MRKTLASSFRSSRFLARSEALEDDLSTAPLVKIESATFYRHHPNAARNTANPPLFPDLTFHLPTQPIEHASKVSPDSGDTLPGQQHWAVLGTNSKTTFLEILRGTHICIPPSARSFPYLSSEAIVAKDHALRSPSRAIQYVGFSGDRGQSSGGIRGAYLSARYESRREDTDWSVLQYLKGETELNPSGNGRKDVRWDDELLRRVIRDLRLGKLIDMPVGNLSNGQTRRARIAKALLGRPELLLLDEPFMGLDPPTLTTLSPILRDLANKSSPRLVLSLRPQDPVPDWITHLIVLGDNQSVALQGQAADVLSKVAMWSNGKDVPMDNGDRVSSQEMTRRYGPPLSEAGHILNERSSLHEVSRQNPAVIDNTNTTSHLTSSKPLIELKSVIVRYGSKIVLGGGKPPGLNLTISRGTRLLILGPNGSGKTTLLSLLTSDHPQSYSLPVFHFGRSRLPKVGTPGISLFDIQSRIGHSSPEIHAFFPKNMSIRGTLESAWAETFITKPHLPNHAHKDIDAVLQWFEPELNPNASQSSNIIPDVSWAIKPHSASSPYHHFSSLPFQTQRLLLLLRAMIKNPDIIILDEAFSGLSPFVREKTIAFLQTGETTHVVPDKKAGKWTRQLGPEDDEKEIRFRGLSDKQALVVVSHVRDEVPGCVREWIRLPGEEEMEEAAGADGASGGLGIQGVRMGKEDQEGGVARSPERWRRLWGL